MGKGFWDVVAEQPSMFAILALAAIVALVLVLGGRSVEATKQANAYADSEARMAEAKARGQEADAAARKAEARVEEIKATVEARRAGVTVDTGSLV